MPCSCFYLLIHILSRCMARFHTRMSMKYRLDFLTPIKNLIVRHLLKSVEKCTFDTCATKWLFGGCKCSCDKNNIFHYFHKQTPRVNTNILNFSETVSHYESKLRYRTIIIIITITVIIIIQNLPFTSWVLSITN